MRAGILVAIVALSLSGCAADKLPSPEQCSRIFTEAAHLTVAIADIATTDEEKLALVARAAAITELAGSFGCPIVIPLLEEDN